MGSIIMWSRDPNPIPEPEPEMIEEPDAIEEVDASEVEQETPLVRAVPDDGEVSELQTGEIEVPTTADLQEARMRASNPPPPPKG